MNEFDLRYKSLNAEQKQAVDTIEGPVMVIAGPGTGKTTILTLRIANILKLTDTPAHGILAITYTDAGVKAMRTKLQAIIGNRAHDVALHTFHSFASSVIADYPDHFLHLTGMKRMTEIEQESLIHAIIADPAFGDLRPMGKPDAYVPGILKGIEESKREAITPMMVRAFALAESERIGKDESSISTRGATKGQLKADAKEAIEKCRRTALFADIYELYESRKKEAKRMDFNDLIIELLVALRTDELLLRLIQERFLYLHVDEHQDTNDAQNFIVALIAEFFETPNIFIVGDEKQAIYRFQGASVENFLLLQKRWPDMQVISLAMNYRSHQSILDASYSMIENNYEEGEHADLRIKLTSGLKDHALKSPVLQSASREFNNPPPAALHGEAPPLRRGNSGAGDSLQDSDAGIPLFKGGADRRKAGDYEAGPVHQAPVTIVTGENVSATELYLVDQLKAISENEPEATVAIIARRNRDLDRIIRLMESHGIAVSSERSVDIFHHPVGTLFFDLIEYLGDPTRLASLAKTVIAGMWGVPFEKAAELVRQLSSGQSAGLDTMLPALKTIRARLLADGAVGCLIHAAEDSGFIELVATDPSYIHVWRGIVALMESLTREGDIREPHKLIKDMMAYRASAESRTVKVTVGAPDVPFRAMTAHGSKGLEFDYVFISYATEEAWVSRNRGASFVLPKKHAVNSDIRDVRRLFYVALTRARKQVTVLTPLEESDGKELSPLRFIAELDKDHVSLVTLPRADLELPRGKVWSPQDVIRTKLMDIAKRVLETKGLSVTALNHFMECPSKFLYQSILKMPQAPSVPAEKGNAMHLALSRAWALEVRTIPNIQGAIEEGISEYLNESFLPTLEKDAVKKELMTDAPAVANALEIHFSVKAAVHTELWVKTHFEGAYEGRAIHMPIHGKIDSIVDVGDEVRVFDYKTRQALSVNAIKGETKNSDGSYFRQLIFYRILLGEDSRWRNRKILPALVFVSPDEKGRCPTISVPIEEADIVRVRAEMQSLIESVWSGKVVDQNCSDEKCEWCGLKRVR